MIFYFFKNSVKFVVTLCRIELPSVDTVKVGCRTVCVVPLYERLYPLCTLQNTIKSLIKDWEQKGVLDLDTCFSRVSHTEIDNTSLARAYALIKIHKVNNPIRIIVSAIGSSTYSLDKSLSILLNKHFPRPKSTIKNSTELIEIR